MKEYETILIGAGPAGLFAASQLNCKAVLLLEQKALPGRKLMMAGSGRCNITHSGNISEFFSHYGKNSRFLRTALYKFTNLDLIEFFSKHGLQSIGDKNGKIFPSTEKSSDILKVLISACKARNVQTCQAEKVVEVKKIDGFFTIITQHSVYRSKYLVIATGGLSYPSTGSTGDGYVFAMMMGHSITPTRPSLSPVYIRPFSMAELAGVSLENKSISLYRKNKKVNEHTGDFGFTHKGLSGPGILDFSRFMMEGDEIQINFLDTSPEQFRKHILEVANISGKQAVQTFLKEYELPRSLVKIILNELNILPELTMANLTREMRVKLMKAFCGYSFIISAIGGYEVAMATHGGISLSEVSDKTMESKLVPGLFFAGEVLDIDGDTGGYNLQAAFSTAYLAAVSINSKTDSVEGFRNEDKS